MICDLSVYFSDSWYQAAQFVISKIFFSFENQVFGLVFFFYFLLPIFFLSDSSEITGNDSATQRAALCRTRDFILDFTFLLSHEEDILFNFLLILFDKTGK